MKEKEEVLFSDGRKVVVTTHELIVDHARYLLKGIEKVRVHFVRHFKFPPITILAAGVISVILGLSGAFTKVHFEELYIGDMLITPNVLAVIIGLTMVLLSMLWLSILHNEYVVVITTNDGDKIPLTSKRKAYIQPIVTALKSALTNQHSNPDHS